MTSTTTTATPRPIQSAPGFLTSALRVFDLSLGEMLWSRRTIFMALVVGAPVIIALILRVVVALGAPLMDESLTGARRGTRCG